MKHITKVESSKQLASFVDFPHDLYKDDPNYVPELFIAQRDILTPGKHPFHEHSQLQCFLAYDDNKKIVGRIAAILNNNSNEFNKANDGFFGFFDCINDQDTANALVDAASDWLIEKKVDSIIGPVNPTTNETCGLLIEGFRQPPVAMMTYNKPYYLQLLENAGFHKKVDLIAYNLLVSDHNEKATRLENAFRERLKRKGITVRTVNMKKFKEEVRKVKEVYNSAWDKNLGFVPMTDKEFAYMAKDMKLILDPDFCLIAEHEGKFVGFALGIPDMNQVLRKVKRGRLLPTGIFKLLFLKKKVNLIRVIALGVIEGYRKMGIEACFYAAIMRGTEKKKMIGAEASWILENNEQMNQALINMGGEAYKKYRIFEKAL